MTVEKRHVALFHIAVLPGCPKGAVVLQALGNAQRVGGERV